MNSRMKVLGGMAAVIFVTATLNTTARAQAAAAPPTDPQIVGIVVAANDIDIDYAKLALAKAQNPEVKEFAQQMVTDHSALQKAVSDLGAKLHVTPADSDTSKSLKAQAAEETTKLNALTGADFDKAYIDNEVAYHKVVIDANANVLTPNAKNAELKSALKGAQPLFQGHLEHAEHIQAALGGPAKSY